MNMPFPSREQVASIRENYPPGTRVMLNNMDDPYSPVESGTRGTVRYVDGNELSPLWNPRGNHNGFFAFCRGYLTFPKIMLSKFDASRP